MRPPEAIYERTVRISQLNGLRALAIGLVLFHHAFQIPLRQIYVDPLANLNLGLSEFWRVFPALKLHLSGGWVGVDMFFILSGFVLFYPYAMEKRRIDGWGDVHWFWFRRARRLLPLLFITSIIFATLKPGAGATETARQLIEVLTLTFHFSPWDWQPRFNPAVWSLGVEIWASAAFPLLIYVAQRKGLKTLLIVSIVCCLMVRIVGAHIAEPARNSFLKDSVFGRIDDFVVGMMLCRMYLDGVRIKMPGLCFWIGFLIVWIAIIPTDIVWLHRFHVFDFGEGKAVLPFLVGLSNNGLQIGVGLMILSALSSQGLLRAVLVFWPIQIIGIMTYSIYLWHMPILRLFEDRGQVFMGFVPLILLVPLSHRFIEFYFDRDLKRIFGLTGSRVASIP